MKNVLAFLEETRWFLAYNSEEIAFVLGVLGLVGLAVTLWDYHRRLKDLKSNLDQAKGEIRTLQGRINYLSEFWPVSRLDGLEKMVLDLSSRVNNLEDDNRMLDYQVKSLEEVNKGLTSRLEKAERAKIQLDARLKRAEKFRDQAVKRLESHLEVLEKSNESPQLSEAEVKVLRSLADDQELRRRTRSLLADITGMGGTPITDSEELQRLHKALEDGRHAGSQLNKSLVSPTGIVTNPGTPDDDTVARKSTETNLATATPPAQPEKEDSDNESTTVRTMLHGVPCNITINQSIKIG